MEKRFESVDNRADARKDASERLLSQCFSDRMKELENQYKFLDSGFPSFAEGAPILGNMGGWSVLGDLVYLDWIEEQEAEDEELNSRVSAETATSSSDRRKSSRLNTPYTPARWQETVHQQHYYICER